jgi:hypothetical protein
MRVGDRFRTTSARTQSRREDGLRQLCTGKDAGARRESTGIIAGRDPAIDDEVHQNGRKRV